MKKLFTLFAMLACVAVSYAQNNLVATLNHNDTVKVYYGSNALKSAHSAAVDGDVITLSSGTFIATDITKGITLRGAGAWLDTVAKRQPTVITGDFKIGYENKGVNNLTIEGIYHNHTITYDGTNKNINLIKSRFKTISPDLGGQAGVLNNATVVHCSITGAISCRESTIDFMNSVISSPDNDGHNQKGTMGFNNCVIREIDGYRVSSSTFSNCVIYQKAINVTLAAGRSQLSASCMAYNCVNPNKVTNADYYLFGKIPNSSNVYSTSEVVFKTYRGTDLANCDSETFALTDSAKTTFLGVDGTQVGIHGGSFPFDPTVSVPQITKFEVAKQSTADGKLNVNIEVNAAAEEPKK